MFDQKTLAEISQTHSQLELKKINGPPQFLVSKATPPDQADSDSVVFASTLKQLNDGLKQRPRLLITSHKITLPDILPADVTIYKCHSVGLAMAAILPFFDTKKRRFDQETKIHPTAILHADAKIHPSAQIGPFCVVGANAEIGEKVIVGPHCVIECNAFVGAETLLHSQVFIGADCSVGKNCEIHPHTTIGSDGFGYSQDQKFQHHKLPQLGRVVLGDRVEIGANCAIDRAAFSETRIGNGTKIDNLCHVAHNCEIGDDSVLAAGFFMAGSSKIGKRFMVGGTSAIADHVTVTDDVILAGRSVIVNDLNEKGAYGGYPVQPMKDYLKTLSSLPHLVRLRKDVAKILKHLGLSEDQHN